LHVCFVYSRPDEDLACKYISNKVQESGGLRLLLCNKSL
jgi:hypothetical protein